jgi:hypothetical protein
VRRVQAASSNTMLARHAGDQGRLTGGPACCYSLISVFLYFSNGFTLIQSKGCLPLHQFFQIKYGCVDDLIRNKFSHWRFSKFEIEFELKTEKQFEPNLIGFEF